MDYGARPLRSTRRLSNLTGQRPGWYSITNAAATDGPTQVSIYDEIGFFGVSAGSFLADLKGVSGDIQLSINSPGGDVFDGIAIYNQLKQRKGEVHVIVDGLAASAASFIAQAASPGKLEVAPHAQIMIHNGFSMAIGDAADLRQTADLLDKITAEIASIYAERSGKPVEHWLAKMAAETWYSDKEAVADGLADSIHGQAPEPKNEWDLTVYGRGTVTEPADPPAASTVPAVADPEPAPVQQAMFPVLAGDVDNSPWDAAKAWHGGTEAGDPEAFYRGICAGRKAGDPAAQDAWALPFKYTPNSPPNAAGVRAALARLSSTKDLTNADEARSKLEKAMKAVNPDYEPDDAIDPGLLSELFTLGLEGAR